MKRFGFGRLFRNNEPVAGASHEPEEVKAPTVNEVRIKPNPGTTILVVDDSKTIQVVLTSMLTQHGYETLSAYDGDQALELTREQKPALVLMDVVMPGMNGFQATREIRRDADPSVSSIPVIIMSGNAQPTEEFWSVKIKANGFIPKPFSNEELLSRIENLLFTFTE